MKEIPEVHDENPSYRAYIERAGISSLKTRTLICIGSNCGERELIINLYVDLPQNMRGVHVSRFIEVLKIVSSENKKYSIYEFIRDIAKKLLNKHPYSTKVYVEIKFVDYIDDLTPMEVWLSKELSTYDNNVERLTLVLQGMTLCPCAQAVYSHLENTPLKNSPSHMQRAVLKLSIESSKVDADIKALANSLIQAFSAPLKPYLKRVDEYLLIKEALNNPKFIEDVVRDAIKRTIEYIDKFMDVDHAIIYVEAVSEESIHPYNIYAYTKAVYKHP